MRIQSPIVVVDDEAEHIYLLAAALAAGGAGYIPLCWDDRLYFISGQVKLAFNTKLNGVRILFCDFHLQKGKSLADKKTHFNAIATAIDDVISEDNGPFVLVIWTKYPEDVDGLAQYIIETVDPHCHPMAVLPLDKTPYLTGKPEDNAPKLTKSISDLLKVGTGTTGLWFWEQVVMSAAAATIVSIDQMARGAKHPVENLLWHLSVAAVGETHVPGKAGFALNEALAPILYDRLSTLSSELDKTEGDFWKKVLGIGGKPPADLAPKVVAKLNSVLHIENGGSGADRGAVISLNNLDALKDLCDFSGDNIKSFITDHLKVAVPDADLTKYKVVAVQIQASCDYAQGNSGLLPFVIAVEAPVDAKFIDSKGTPQKKFPPYFTSSPPLLIDEHERILHINSRYLFSLSKEDASAVPCLYRLRESLTNKVASTVYGYGSRYGVVALS